MKKLLCAGLFFTAFFTTAIAQSGLLNKAGTTKKFKPLWTTKPFDHQVFIANAGQFDSGIVADSKILYGIQLGGVWAFFTNHGIIYKYTKFPKEKETGKKEDRDKDKSLKPESYCQSVNWDNANPDVSIIAQEQLSYPFTYPKGRSGTIRTRGFKKLIYKNLYPGIDVEYKFPENKEGFEYSLIVNPGADLSTVILNYQGAKQLYRNINGNIIIKSSVGEITDHAPVSYYSGEDSVKQSKVICSSYVKGTREFFNTLQEYDKSRTLVIDPWVTNPGFINNYHDDDAYDICYDYKGNVYVMGGLYPYPLVKLNSSGVIQWTFSSYTFAYNSYGDFAVNRKSGTCYIVAGIIGQYDWDQVMKVNTLGNLIATYTGADDMNEMWRAAYNPCFDNIVIGCGGTGGTNQACMLDTNLVSITPVNFLSTNKVSHDVSLLCVDPNGLYCYMALSLDAIDSRYYNSFARLPLPALFPPTYTQFDNFNFVENGVPWYIIAYGANSNAMNGMAASPDWLYLYDGASLKQYYKNTGIMNDSIAVSITPQQWGGMDVDVCDDIYLGCNDSVKYYNSSLALTGSVTMPGTVYCLTLGQNNQMYVGGNGFVAAVNVPAPKKMISSVTGKTATCSKCNGSAKVSVNCGVTPFSYRWSDGSTNQTDSGLCAGTYRVIVSDASCPPRLDTATVSIAGTAGFTASVTDTNPGCSNTHGKITAYPTGGIAPYTYVWSNGATTKKDTGLIAGTYTVTISDGHGCDYTISITLVKPLVPAVTVSPASDSICKGTSVVLSAGGGKTYTWAPNKGLSCYTCISPSASPTTTTTYTLTGKDSDGCTNTSTVTINVLPLPSPVISGKLQACKGFNDTLTISGGTTYLWSNGSANNQYIFSNLTIDSSITVKVFEGICFKDTTIKVTVKEPPVVSIQPATVCRGECTTLTAKASGGGNKFLWSNGAKTDTITVCPVIATHYTVTVSNGCVVTDTVTVEVTPALGLKGVEFCCDTSVGAGQKVQLSASGAGPGVSYFWSPSTDLSCNNCPNPIATPSVTTTYTVTVSDSGCAVSSLITIDVDCNIFVPEAFSPSGFGSAQPPYNNILYVRGLCISTLYFAIYDRWGNKVFDTHTQATGWNGNYREQPMNTGTYIWYLNATLLNGTTIVKKGNVALVR